MDSETPADEQKPIGRPTLRTRELGELIYSLLAQGQSLRKICSLQKMPHISTIVSAGAKIDQ